MHRLAKKYIFFICFFCVQVLSTFGQSTDESYIYTRSGSLENTPETEAFQFVKIIPKEDIQLLNAQNLNDLLRYTLYSSSFYTGVEGYNFGFIQTGRKNVKILYNGQPMWQNSIDKIDISNLLLIDIERIEIMHGSSSVFYGSNAILAVINVISTNQSKKLTDFKLQGNASTADEFNLNSSFAYNSSRHKVSAKFGRFFHYGIHGSDSGRVYEWKPNQKYATNLGYTYVITHGLTADFSFNYLNSLSFDYGYPVEGTTRVTDTKSNRHIISSHGGLSGKLSKFHSIQFIHNYTAFQEEHTRYDKILSQGLVRKDANVLPGDRLHYDQYWSSLFLGKRNPKQKLSYVMGMEFTHQRDQANVTQALKTRSTQFSSSGNISYRANEEFKLETGLRLSKSNAFKTPPAYELKSWYYMSSNTVLRTAFSSAYRIPTFNELFYTYEDPEKNIKGNLNLESETFYHFNVILDIRSDHVRFSSNMMWLHTNNGIQLTLLDPVENSYSFLNRNRSKMMTQGLSLQFDYGDFSANVGVANTGLDQFPDELGNYYFSQEAAINAKYRWPKNGFVVGTYLKWNSARNEIRINTNGVWEDYSLGSSTLLDISASKEFVGTGFTISFGLKNILDVSTVSGAYLPWERFSNKDVNLKVPVNIDYGRRFWTSLVYHI
jgi:outer membrane cobalamin receptor